MGLLSELRGVFSTGVQVIAVVNVFARVRALRAETAWETLIRITALGASIPRPALAFELSEVERFFGVSLR